MAKERRPGPTKFGRVPTGGETDVSTLEQGNWEECTYGSGREAKIVEQRAKILVAGRFGSHLNLLLS